MKSSSYRNADRIVVTIVQPYSCSSLYCIHRYEASQIDALVRKHSRGVDPNEARYQVTEIRRHPQNIPYSYENDMALLRYVLTGTEAGVWEGQTEGRRDEETKEGRERGREGEKARWRKWVRGREREEGAMGSEIGRDIKMETKTDM